MKEFRRVFITGASSGLGAGLARHYGQAGSIVGLVARRGELLEALADALREAGAVVHAYTQDVADTGDMDGVIRDFLVQAGGVDLAIANAGVGLKFSVQEETAEQVVRMMNVNINGLVNTLLPFVPAMLKQRHGVLVGMSSVAGFRALPWRSAYCASKAAVKTYMDGIRMELRGTGVHAMTICPGFVDTPLTADTPARLFLLDVPAAVRKMTRGIARRRKTLTFPWQITAVKPLWWLMPEALYVKLVPPPKDAGRTCPPADHSD